MDIDSAAEAWINLVIKRAGDLRRAGILSIGFDDCTAEVSPHDPMAPIPPSEARAAPEPDYTGDPLNDPASYPGGIVPGFDIRPLGKEH